MPTIALLLAACLVTMIAMIGLADLFTHALCRAARSLRTPGAVREAASAGDDGLAA